VQDTFSSVEDRQWLSWGSLLLLELKKLMEDEEAECEYQAHLEEICAMEEASRKAEEDQRIMEEAMATLLENSEEMLAKDFALRICSIECEFGFVSVGEGGDDIIEVLEKENTGDVNRLQIPINQDHLKPCPLTKPRPIAFKSVNMDEDNENESKDSDIVEVHTLPSKTRSKLLGRSKHKQSLGECYERTFILSFSILSYLITGYLI